MTEREVLKLALEAFEWNYNTDLDNIPAYEKWAKMLKENITAIREALAQPEQICGLDVVLDESMPPNTFKLAQPEQEPVVYGIRGGLAHDAGVKND